MVWRRRRHPTRSSRRSPLTAGAAGGRGAAPAAGAGAGAGVGRWLRLLALAAASTSSLVRRPSLPVPLIFDGSSLMLEHRAAHRRRQRQMRPSASCSSSASAPSARSRASGFSPAPAGLIGVADRGRAAGARGAAAPSSIRAITAPTATVSPSGDDLLAHHAGDRRRHLDRDLVGLEAGDRLVGRDRVAGLLEPLRRASPR